MSNAQVDQVIQEKIIEFDRLLAESVPDDATRSALRHEYVSKINSPLSKRAIGVSLELDETRKEHRFYHYEKAGVPPSAHEILDTVYDGRDVTVDSVRELAQANGFQVDGGASKEPEPGDPDYVWSSPAERRAYQEGQTNE